MGLLAVPLLPDDAETWIERWQKEVSKSWDNITNLNREQPTHTPTAASSSAQFSPVEISKVDRLVAEIEQLVHELINHERDSGGISVLRHDARLSDIARGHSQDMAQRGYFAHENLSGQDPSDRAAQTGYVCRKDYGSFYTEGVAENIFQNWLYSSITYVGPIPIKNYVSSEGIAESTVAGWMESPGHRENILNRDYDRVGTGVAVSHDEKVYITQNFC